MEFPLLSGKSEASVDSGNKSKENEGLLSTLSDTWAGRAVNGFIDGAKDVVRHPGETAALVGTGVAAGALIQFGLNNAEKLGGGIGLVARAARVGVIAAPILHSVSRVIRADDAATEAGKVVFETGMFLGAAKLGSYMDRIPRVGKIFGPEATSPVPEKLQFQVLGDKVKFANATGETVQVRLANGKGFVTDRLAREGVVQLVDMPKQIPGAGRLEYAPSSTTLVNEAGSFTRPLDSRSITVVRDGHTIATNDGKTFTVARPNGDHVSFFEDGKITAMQGKYESGTFWEFGADGAMSMKSSPAGKYSFVVSAEGEGSFTYIHGTSRGIRGIGGPRVRHAPLKTETKPFSVAPGETTVRTPYGDWTKPDLTAVSVADKSNLARVLDVLGNGKLPTDLSRSWN